MAFVRAPNPVWYFVDNDGKQLDDTFYLFVLQNVFPYLPSPVYQDNQGIHPWTEPVQFLANGTLPNNLYFNPDFVYRLQVRQGNTMDAPLIDDVLNFVPGQGQVIPPQTTSAYDNQITNPQFAFIDFVSPLSITSAGTYTVAPGWQLVLTGSGSTTVTQNIFTGNEVSSAPIPGAPPAALQIANNGWTTAILQQTFIKNGALWGDEAVSASITASAVGIDQLISMNYVPSEGAATTIIGNEIVTTGIYAVIENAVSLPPSTSSQPSNLASVSIQIVLPTNGTLSLTNVQVFGQALPLTAPYIEETVNRAIDHSFNVYYNSILIKPKNSILTGWNFALNPFQFNSVSLTGMSAQCQYVADQTIIYQETAGNISTGRAPLQYGGGLQVAPNGSATNTRFALIQYIDPTTIAPYWNFYLSVLSRARIVTTSGSVIPVKMRLIYRDNFPPTLSGSEPIASWPLNADPIFSNGWTALKPLNDPAYILQNPSVAMFESGITAPPVAYNQFAMPVAQTSTMTLGIVLYTMQRMAVNAGDSIIFDKVDLVANEFAIDTQPQTFDDVVRQCQYFYEKSYNNAVLPGTNTGAGVLQVEQFPVSSGASVSLITRGFSWQFNSIKRANPSVVTYAVDGTPGYVTGSLFNNATGIANTNIPIGNWQENAVGQKSVCFLPVNLSEFITTAATPQTPEAFLNFHYTADARLGI